MRIFLVSLLLIRCVFGVSENISKCLKAKIEFKGKNHKVIYEKLIEYFKEIDKADKFENVIRNSNPWAVKSYLNLFENAMSDDEFLKLWYLFDIHLLDFTQLPHLHSENDYRMLFDLLSLQITPEVKAFAQLNWKELEKTYPSLSLKLKKVAESQELDLIYQVDSDGLVSLVWHPKNPEVDGSYVCSHAKLIVDGQVWSTFGSFDLIDTSVEAFRRLGSQKRGRETYEFVIRPNPEELEKLKYFLRNNEIGRVKLPTCIGGACAALSESGVLKIPPPFSLLPSTASLYLKLSSYFPGKVLSVKFNGRNQIQSILNANVIVDGVVVGTISLVGGSLIYKLLIDDE